MRSDDENLVALLEAIRDLMLCAARSQSLSSIVEWIDRQQPTGRLTKVFYGDEWIRRPEWHSVSPETIFPKQRKQRRSWYSHPAFQIGLAVSGILGAWLLPHFSFRVVLCAVGVASVIWWLWDIIPLSIWWTLPRRSAAASVAFVLLFVPSCYAIKNTSEFSGPPVRDYGNRIHNFSGGSWAGISPEVFYYTTVCFANFGDKQTDVQIYDKEEVLPNNKTPAKLHRIIEGLEDDLAAETTNDTAAVERYQPGEKVGDCDLTAPHAFSFMKDLTFEQFALLHEHRDLFLYVGRLVERNSDGTTYLEVCGVSMSDSMTIQCPESGSK